MQNILSIHDAPFDATAGVICSPRISTLDRWQEAKLAIWKRYLSQTIINYLKRQSTASVLQRLDDVMFRVIIRNGEIFLQYDSYEKQRIPEDIKSKTSFASLFNNDTEALPVVRDMEARAWNAIRLLGKEDLFVRMRTMTALMPHLHIDFVPNLATMYGEYTTLVADPNSAILKESHMDVKIYECNDLNQMRKLGQGDVCMIGEMPHTYWFTPEGRVYRGGPWLGFYSYAHRNQSFKDFIIA